MSKKKWPWIAVDVSEVLDEDGFPEISVCYDNEFDAQAEAAERNAEEEQ